mmetsp:Transcript_25625/g.50158  ORF Transcript_25625/g.50158 Transcript_25625/m.50158 type:complete len:84 (-) Transcript_25625:850-1101(-)
MYIGSSALVCVSLLGPPGRQMKEVKRAANSHRLKANKNGNSQTGTDTNGRTASDSPPHHGELQCMHTHLCDASEIKKGVRQTD